MNKLGFIFLVSLFIICCKASDNQILGTNSSKISKGDTINIVNDSLEYEITIIEPGFNSWLQRMARPIGYYSLAFLESRNQILVSEWNRRVLLPSNYPNKLYEMQIDYNVNLDYGYEVNYKLYNYFIYFQLNYKQQLSGLIPKI